MKDSNNATEALRRLLAAMLNEDATIRNRDEAYDNLHDHVLDACRHAGVPLPSDTKPAPVRKRYVVEGSVHYTGGFNFVLYAETLHDARNQAEALIDTDRSPDKWGAELQEICVSDCHELKESA